MPHPYPLDAPLTNGSLRTILALALRGAANALSWEALADTPERATETTPHSAYERTGRLTLNVAEAAEVLGVGRGLIYELVGSGQLASIKVGERRLVPVSALEDFVAEGATSP